MNVFLKKDYRRLHVNETEYSFYSQGFKRQWRTEYIIDFFCLKTSAHKDFWVVSSKFKALSGKAG